MLSRILLLLSLTNIAFAGPWMTGPLLAPSGKTIPAGHVNLEPYGFYTAYPNHFKNIEGLPIVSIGLGNFLDVQMTLPFDYSWVDHVNGSGIGDYNLAMGIQLFRQNEHVLLPDVRLVLQQTFPTGKYDHLNPDKLGTDQTGSGASSTLMSLNLQHLKHFSNDHYLRTRLSLSGSRSSHVEVFGFNAFGGTADTEGFVHPGKSYSADLAFEYALTQNWVPVFEILYTKNTASDFVGNPGFSPGGTLANIGGPGAHQTSLAPAIEYNFTGNLGVIAGVWFSVSGPDAAKFTTGAVAINYYI